MSITVATLAYPDVPTHVRARIAATVQSVAPPPDTFILSTCLRTEIAVAGDRDTHDAVIARLLPSGTLPDGVVVREGDDAVLHLFRVAAGLESPIVGEMDVLTQYRQALRTGIEDGRIDGVFARLLQAGVAAGRGARDLMPESPHESMASVAADLVVAAPAVAVLGSGIMAQAAVRRLLVSPTPPAIRMVARRPDLVDLPGIDVSDFSELETVLATYPAVISATSASSGLLSEDHLAATLVSRTDPLTLVDLAMPPDFVPPADMPVHHYDIDDLARIASDRHHPVASDDFVADRAGVAHRQYDGHGDIGPLIGELMQRADGIVDRSVARFAPRLGSASDEAVLRQAVHTVARAMLAQPVDHLKDPETGSDDVDAIARAFRVSGAKAHRG